MKICKRCEKEFPPEGFHSRGRGVRDTLCSGCRGLSSRGRYADGYSAEQRERLERLRASRALPPDQKIERRKEWSRKLKKQRADRLLIFKRGKPCSDCENSFHPQSMDFDHRGDKTMNVSVMAGRRSWADILIEISKCDLVCANCHRVRTARRRLGLPATLPPPEYHI